MVGRFKITDNVAMPTMPDTQIYLDTWPELIRAVWPPCQYISAPTCPRITYQGKIPYNTPLLAPKDPDLIL